MIDLNTLNKLEELKKAMIEEDKKNNDGNITKVEINIETKGNKDSNIFENKIYSKSVHSNFEKEVVVNRINKNIQIKRGEIWMVDLGNNGNSIQSFRHPFLVTSNDLNNQHSPNITGCSGTSKMKARLPVHVEIEQGCGGLKVRTTILCETLRPIDRSKFLYKMGEVDDNIMLKVKKAINIQNGDIKPKTELERLPQTIQNMINEKLEDIKSVERTITNIKRESLVKHLMDEREAHLLSLERICKKYNLDYKDYYVMYRKEEEKIVI